MTQCWDSAANGGLGGFSGATALDCDGNETLIKLEFTSSVAVGTIMRSGTKAQWLAVIANSAN